MQISLILAHPDAASFNHAIAETCRRTLEEKGHRICFHDLYGEKFDPLLPASEFIRDATLPDIIHQHCVEIADADGIIIVHPNWWGMPPAILKGWIDRVIRPDVAYRFEEGDKGGGVPGGLLKAKSALIFNTSNTADEREMRVFGDPLETIWKNCIFGLCGIQDVRRRTFNIVVTSTQDQRVKWLNEVKNRVSDTFETNL